MSLESAWDDSDCYGEWLAEMSEDLGNSLAEWNLTDEELEMLLRRWKDLESEAK